MSGQIASLIVPAEAFAQGQLPPVCVITGRPATRYEGRNIEKVPQFAYLGLAVGFIGYVILRSMTVKIVTGSLPFDPEAAKAHEPYVEQRNRKLQGGAFLAAMGILVLGFAYVRNQQLGGYSGVFTFIGAMILVTSLVPFALAIRSPLAWLRPTLDESMTRVTLHNVSPAFARAVDGRISGPFSNYPAASLQAVPAAGFMTPPPGWYRDPSGRAESRYWDGAGWTAHVAGPTGQGIAPL